MYGSPAVGQFRDVKRSDYPVSVEFIIPAHNGRFWAIPLVGYLARMCFHAPVRWTTTKSSTKSD